jgi:alpha-L-rhamnosidase
MRAWVDYIQSVDEASGGRRLWTEGTHFGDWLALDGDDPTSRKGGTPDDFIASAFYCYSVHLVAKAASVLGKTEETEVYKRLSEEVKAAIQTEYFTPSGRLAVATQTGYVLALFMDLAPEITRDRVKNDLITKLNSARVHLQTGFVGTPYLCRVLSNIGANDLAYRLLLNEDYPSWLYAVNLGATTIWERWNSLNPDGTISSTGMNSLNHYAYGSIVEWMYRDMCGLNPSTGEDGITGFRHARIAPKPDKSLQWARARYRSAAGVYESGWRINESGHITIEIAVPFNATASVILPAAHVDDISLNGHPLREGEQVGDNVELTLGAGCHELRYPFREKAAQT